MMVIFYMLMILIRSSLQGRELKEELNCAQVQDHLRFIDFTSERDAYARKIKFRMVSAQHFINESPHLCSIWFFEQNKGE